MNLFLLGALAPLELSDNAKVAAAVALGIACGFLLLKSDLIWRKSILDMLTLKDGRLIKTFLLILTAGTFLFFEARVCGVVQVSVRSGYFWASLCGGIISGIGLVLCAFTPLHAISALGAGRIYAVWALLGMFLSLPAVYAVNNTLSQAIGSWGDEHYSPPMPEHFFMLENPALFIVGIGIFLILLVHFTVGDSQE